ncbi:rhodanese-like domain-containing protein [Amedibacillus sp. YH-ame10]
MFFKKFDKDMSEVKQEMQQGTKIQLVDVRFEEEYIEGHIPNAILIPLPQLEELADTLLNKDSTTYVYCRSGQRASKAVMKLKAMGYHEVYNVGGIIHWNGNIEKSQ